MMIESVKQRSLPQSSRLPIRERTAIVDVAQDALIGLTWSGIVRTWNAGAVRLFGYTAAQMTGQPVSLLADPEHTHEQQTFLRVACAGSCVGPVEARCRRQDGSAVTAELTLIPILDAYGCVSALAASIRDISAHKRAEAMRALVVEELNHRINNTMATVGAIATQSLQNATSLESFGKIFGARLQSLSTTHNMLARNAWCGTTVSALVETELAAYEGRDAPRWKTCGGETHVGSRHAQALSMVLHELATNAAKYGALSVPHGQVHISWEVCAAKDKHRLKFAWTESAGPLVVTPTRTGFGTRLITDGIASQLNGAATLTYAPSGVQFSLDVPFEFAA